VIISFKGTHGWIELETNHCKSPDFEIHFELKLHHSLLNRKRYLQNQPILLRFFLLDKQEDGNINNIGEVLLNVLLMSSKCSNRTLIARLFKNEKNNEFTLPIPQHLNVPLPVERLQNIPENNFYRPTDSRKYYEESESLHNQHHLYYQN